MQVFKAYFKIIKKNMGQMILFLGIFAALAVAFSNVGVGTQTKNFVSSKPDIAFFSKDNDTVLVKGFRDYLSSVANIVSIKDNEDAIQDALFFRKVTYIVMMPAGFAESILTDGAVKMERKMVPDSFDAMYLDYVVNKFWKAVQIYSEYTPKYTQTQIVEYVKADFAKTPVVSIQDTGAEKSTANNSVYFFNYFAYSLLAIIILGISSFMITFQNTDLRRRNTASPMSLRSMNMQLVAGNMIFAALVWIIMFSLAVALYGKSLFNITAVYYAINTLVYTLVCVSISFLIGNLAQSRNAQAAIVNVLALGLSFISGVFVPQEMLGATVLSIARFTPTYWFVHANIAINEVDMANNFSFQLISTEILVQLAFATLLFGISIVAIRIKRTSNS